MIPGGLVIDLFSQYLGWAYLQSNLVYVSIAIALCGVVFLLNRVAVLAVLVCNTAMMVELHGFASWLGLRNNGVLVLNSAIAVRYDGVHGASGAPSCCRTCRARTASASLPSLDDAQIRLKKKTLREMFTSVSLVRAVRRR